MPDRYGCHSPSLVGYERQEMKTIVVHVVRDSLKVKHFIVRGDKATACGVGKKFVTPSFGDVNCRICKGHAHTYNGGHKS